MIQDLINNILRGSVTSVMPLKQLVQLTATNSSTPPLRSAHRS